MELNNLLNSLDIKNLNLKDLCLLLKIVSELETNNDEIEVLEWN